MSLSIRNLHCVTPALNIDTLHFEEAQIYVVLGPNGAGKSSLLRAVTGLLDEVEWSEFLIMGRAMNELSAQERAALIGYCPQNLAPHPDLNVERFLAGSTFSLGLSPSESLRAARTLLQNNMLESLAKRSLSTLSGGEWQRIVLLSLELKDSPFWILDEPTNHLDPLNQIDTLHYLADQVVKHRRTVIAASHDLSLLGLLDRPQELPPPQILCIKDGKLTASLPLNSERLSEELGGLFGISVCAAKDSDGRTFLYAGREKLHAKA